MNGSRSSIDRLVNAIVDGMASSPMQVGQAREVGKFGSEERVVAQIFPPAVYLRAVIERLAEHPHGQMMCVGAQNIHQAPSGAYTGEVSAEMVADIGATHVLVGHSERRQMFGEDNALVAAKFVAAGRAGLVPVLCLGETLQERESGVAEKVVLEQLDAVIRAAGIDAFRSAMLAYEPVWAIGTGLTASPDDAQQMHARIRAHIARQVAGEDTKHADLAEELCILYGGSVKGENASTLFGCEDVDGGLVGGASLEAAAFLEIWQAART